MVRERVLKIEMLPLESIATASQTKREINLLVCFLMHFLRRTS